MKYIEKNQLKSGEIYVGEYPTLKGKGKFIIQYGSKQFLDFNPHSNPTYRYGLIYNGVEYRMPTEDERDWLLACIKADTFVQPVIENYEIY